MDAGSIRHSAVALCLLAFLAWASGCASVRALETKASPGFCIENMRKQTIVVPPILNTTPFMSLPKSVLKGLHAMSGHLSRHQVSLKGIVFEETQQREKYFEISSEICSTIKYEKVEKENEAGICGSLYIIKRPVSNAERRQELIPKVNEIIEGRYVLLLAVRKHFFTLERISNWHLIILQLAPVMLFPSGTFVSSQMFVHLHAVLLDLQVNEVCWEGDVIGHVENLEACTVQLINNLGVTKLIVPK